jgi:uncharacterized GH25 family protein
MIGKLHAAVLGFAALAAPLASSHDFWVQPERFVVPNEDVTRFTLQAGHGPERQRSRIPLARIVRFADLTPLGQESDLRAALHSGAGHRFEVPGAHLVYLVSDNRAQSHLPAARFNAYLREEGLAAAPAHAGHVTERYRRVAKALVQVGPVGAGGQDQASRALGLPLEIVPERSPYLVPKTALMPVRVLYEGRPLAGGLVKLTNLDDDAAPVDAQRTDAAGIATFRMPPAGNWLLNVVWTTPVHGRDGIDYETVFSSLSFGVAAQ